MTHKRYDEGKYEEPCSNCGKMVPFEVWGGYIEVEWEGMLFLCGNCRDLDYKDLGPKAHQILMERNRGNGCLTMFGMAHLQVYETKDGPATLKN